MLAGKKKHKVYTCTRCVIDFCIHVLHTRTHTHKYIFYRTPCVCGFVVVKKKKENKYVNTPTYTTHCTTTDQFLKTKLFNFRQALWQTHGAIEAQLDAAEKYLVKGVDDADGGSASSLVKYAYSLHGQSPEAIRTKGALFVRFCGVPEEQHDAAVALVIRYLDMFLAVVHPGCE